MSALESLLVCARDPQGQQSQYASGPLEAWQGLPFSFEDREDARVQRIGAGESLARGVDREPIWDLLPVLNDPVGVFRDGSLGIIVQPLPFKQATPDDLGGFRLRGHHDRLADPVKHLLEPLLVRFVVGTVRHFRRRNGYQQDDLVRSASLLREGLNEVIQGAMVALVTICAGVVDHLVHQDEAGLVLWQESLNHVTLWLDKLMVVLSHGGKTGLATELPRNFTPRSLAERSPVIAATAGDGIELGADEDRNCRLRNGGHLGRVEDTADTRPAMGLWPVLCQVVQQSQRVGFPASA